MVAKRILSLMIAIIMLCSVDFATSLSSDGVNYEITVPDSIEAIEVGAFRGMRSDLEITVRDEATRAMVVESGVAADSVIVNKDNTLTIILLVLAAVVLAGAVFVFIKKWKTKKALSLTLRDDSIGRSVQPAID
jgi:hypothetical protein